MKFDFDRIINEKMLIDVLEVHSYELNIYLIKLQIGEQRGMLYRNNELMRFNSSQQIRDYFESIHVVKAVMVHASAYDEMIGGPPKSNESMALPFSMSQKE